MIYDLVQNCSISITNTLKILPSSIKPRELSQNYANDKCSMWDEQCSMWSNFNGLSAPGTICHPTAIPIIQQAKLLW